MYFFFLPCNYWTTFHFLFLERGVVWEETIILLPDNVHYVFLSATIPNARQFAEWIAHLHKQVDKLLLLCSLNDSFCIALENLELHLYVLFWQTNKLAAFVIWQTESYRFSWTVIQVLLSEPELNP